VVPSRLEGLDLLPARPELRLLERRFSVRELSRAINGFISGKAEYDAFLFDVPPFLGVLAGACYAACDSVILPVTPDAWSLESISLTMRDIAAVCGEAGRSLPSFAVLPNRVNPNRRSTGEIMSRLEEEYARFLLPFSVQESAGGLNAMNDGLTVFDRRDAKALRASIVKLARHICPPARLGER
jgi:chromosome partitioning protein